MSQMLDLEWGGMRQGGMPVRRRSAWWIRELPQQTLHRIGGKLYNLSQVEELTEGQEHLWSMIVSELEYRARKVTPADRCTCALCCTPFPD